MRLGYDDSARDSATTMADEQDDDALFDRLAKSLEAARHDAQLARSGGVAGISASMANNEEELHRLAAELDALSRRFDERERGLAARDAALAARADGDLRVLRQAVEALSRRLQI